MKPLTNKNSRRRADRTLPFSATRFRREAGILLAVSLCGCAALAQDSESAGQARTAPASQAEAHSPWPEAGGDHPVFGVQLSYDYVAQGGVSYRGITGHSDASSIRANVMAEIPLNEQWFVPVGIRSADQWLGTIAGVPIPDRLNTLSLGAGLGCHVNERWTVAGSLGPSIYRFDDVGHDEVGVNGMIRATYKWRPDVTIGFGIAFEPDNDIPVMPVAGLRWAIRTNLTLNLMFPRPALIYRLNSRFDLFAAGGGDFTVFRTESDFGNQIGQARYNNALGTYRDFHFGGGAECRLPFGAALSVETGYSFRREIKYKDIDETVSFDPGLYVQAGLRWRF